MRLEIEIAGTPKLYKIMENEKMRLLAYAKLLNKKINSAHIKAKNPFLDYDGSINPFMRPIYNTLVWIEPDENDTNRFE